MITVDGILTSPRVMLKTILIWYTISDKYTSVTNRDRVYSFLNTTAEFYNNIINGDFTPYIERVKEELENYLKLYFSEATFVIDVVINKNVNPPQASLSVAATLPNRSSMTEVTTIQILE